jgi:hypothetical protein
MLGLLLLGPTLGLLLLGPMGWALEEPKPGPALPGRVPLGLLLLLLAGALLGLLLLVGPWLGVR